MVQELFIIGNGFDLYHGLATRYTDFIEYMKSHYPEEYGWLYDSIRRYSLDYWDLIGKGRDQIIWSDMENVLGSFEPLELLEEHRDWNTSEDYKGPASEEIRHLLNFGMNVNEYLHGWIKELNRDISSIQGRRWISRLFEEKENLTLSFNYTLTIEKLYRKPVLHIHGRKREKLIMGHGNYNGGDIQSDNFGINLVNERYVKRYFHGTYKNCQKIMEKHAGFFSKSTLGGIRKVYVLGHSLNNVDMPYIRRILELIGREAEWRIVCYDEESRRQYQAAAEELFGNSRKYEVIFWDELQKKYEG